MCSEFGIGIFNPIQRLLVPPVSAYHAEQVKACICHHSAIFRFVKQAFFTYHKFRTKYSSQIPTKIIGHIPSNSLSLLLALIILKVLIQSFSSK